MRFPIAVAAIAFGGLAGCTGDDGAVRSTDAWALATANPVAPPVSCVEKARIAGTAVRDDRTVDFSLDDGRLMRNRLPQICQGLRGSRFIQRSATDRLCSTDTITLVRADGSARASCGLGSFQQITVPPRG
ncbi:hypothetical protein [Sphingosinicella sp. YJ22]|uniref:hypothetical protein n=1 Tax=Sphingosinicella sp. YJ22 TaxID=1104780 RepID=UPI00140AFAF3|nr:hypothetical protein [Sphingosinicella sp. YJ22]